MSGRLSFGEGARLGNEEILCGVNVLARAPVLTIPVLMPFVNRCGLSDGGFFWLQAAFTGGGVLLGIPGGHLADRYGRKAAIQAGAVLWGVGIAGYLAADNVAGLVAAELFWAAGTALVSGADIALLKATLRQEDRLKEMPRALGRISSIGQFGEVPLFALGGLLAVFGPQAPFIGALLLLVVLCLWSRRLSEISSAAGRPAARGASRRAGWLALCENRRLAWLMAFQALLMSFTLAAFWSTSPLLRGYHVAEAWDGWWFAGMAAIIAAANRCAARLVERCKGLPWWLAGALIAGFAGAASGSLMLMVLGTVLQKAVLGVALVYCKERIVAEAPEKMEATVLSVGGVFVALAQLLLLLLWGWLLGKAEPVQSICAMAAGVIAVGVALLWLTRDWLNHRGGG